MILSRFLLVISILTGCLSAMADELKFSQIIKKPSASYHIRYTTYEKGKFVIADVSEQYFSEEDKQDLGIKELASHRNMPMTTYISHKEQRRIAAMEFVSDLGESVILKAYYRDGSMNAILFPKGMIFNEFPEELKAKLQRQRDTQL